MNTLLGPMSTLMEQMQDNIPNKSIVRNCAESGCTVPLTGAPSPFLLIDVNECFINFPDKARCDFLFIGQGNVFHWVIPLELKKGAPRATEIAEQLQAGAEFAQNKIPEEHATKFIPVGAYGGRLHKFHINRLKNTYISFRGKKYEIKLIRCGTPLKNALP